MTVPVLSQRTLRLTLLERQSLLERSSLSLTDAIDRIGGLQTQYAPSGYVSLWTRLRGFERAALTRELEERTVVQATLMRTTIHIVTRREFWRYALGVRKARREAALRTRGTAAAAEGEAAMLARAAELRAALADGPRSVAELDGLAGGFVGNLAVWLDLVRVPPSGTWERRRADRLGLADAWVGPPDATEADGLAHLVRAYLRAFGPAPWRDIAAWAGIPVADAKRGGERVALRGYRDEAGRPLVDLADARLADPERPAPVRFLAHWDPNLLVHTRRTGLVPEPFRPILFHSKNPFSVGTFLVDGVVAGSWSVRDGRVVTTALVDLTSVQARAVEREREALEAFHR